MMGEFILPEDLPTESEEAYLGVSAKRWDLHLVEIDEFEYADVQILGPLEASELALEIADKEIGSLDREAILAIWLDSKNRPVAYQIVHLGTLNHSLIHPREIFKVGIVSNAEGLIIAHNHPSGVARASEMDRNVTRRLVDTARTIGINLLDHIIVSPTGDWVSLQQEEPELWSS